MSVGGTVEATDLVVDGRSLRDRVFDLQQENQELRREVQTLQEQKANFNETLRFVLSVLTPATDSPTTLTTTKPTATTAMTKTTTPMATPMTTMIATALDYNEQTQSTGCDRT